MSFLPSFPLHINPTFLFGIVLLLGLLAGELVRKIRFLPRIFGYIVVGFLIGPYMLNVVDQKLLIDTRIFVDISLGLILFDLGRHLDISWLRRDVSLLYMSITECALTFILIFVALIMFGLPVLSAALAGTIAIATSPAVVMMVAHDLSAQGPVTRRTLMLTSLNNFVALILFSLLIPMAEQGVREVVLIEHSVYRLFGSFALGILIFLVVKTVAYLIGKRRANQFVLFVAAVILAISIARLFNFSSMLTLFVFGVAARNLDYKHWLVEVDFGWLARLFLIVLFVFIGAQLQLHGLSQVIVPVIIFILARAVAKFLGVGLFAKFSRLTAQQSFSISLALLPMAGVALGMSNTLIDFNPDFGHSLTLIILSVLAILTFVGPIATQYAFLRVGEAAKDRMQESNKN